MGAMGLGISKALKTLEICPLNRTHFTREPIHFYHERERANEIPITIPMIIEIKATITILDKLTSIILKLPLFNYAVLSGQMFQSPLHNPRRF